MKKLLVAVIILFVNFSASSQVGVGNTNPQATLDVSASNVATPANNDGILIPRMDEFPSTNPTAAQDGMMVFITGNGTPSKGFYYWDNSAGPAAWLPVGGASGAEVIDELLDGKSDSDGSNDGSSVFLGVNAGASDDSSDNRNVGVGFEALQSNSTGANNTAIGYLAMEINTIGSQNTAIGLSALRANVDGNGNTAVGYHSLFSNDDGSNNTSTGQGSLNSNVSGSFNTANGTQALFFNSGASNTGSGYRALYSNIAGTRNSAFGLESLNLNSNGSDNVAVGYRAGRASLGSNNIFLGASAGTSETGSNKLYIESSNADANNALIYGEFDNDILRTNGQLQIGNPTGTGYAFPTIDGTNGQILTTDGAGQIAFSTLTTGGSLDNAYDFGGAGAGRVIIADNGAVEVQGTGGLRVEDNMVAAEAIVHDADADTFVQFTPDRVEIDAGARNYLNINHTNFEVAFNEDSEASDFRVESDGETRMLFVDGSANTVGIGEAAPDSPLHIGISTSFDLDHLNAGQDGVFIEGGGDNSGENAVGGSISFGPPHPTREEDRKSAISSVQTSGDVDHTGLAFYVHGNAVNQSPMVEGMRLTHNRRLEINTTDPSATLDVVGTMQFEDGNEAAGYVLSSDATGNATWTDPSTLSIGGSLDDAYDNGGAGVGRVITADNGAVEVQGAGGLRVEDDIVAAEAIVHDADTDTFVQFTDNRLEIDAGGRNYMNIQHSAQAVVFNEDGEASDFRVEGGTLTNTFFVDGSTDRVGLGTASPGAFTEIDVPTDEAIGVVINKEYAGTATFAKAMEINTNNTSTARNLWGIDLQLTGSTGSLFSKGINLVNTASSGSQRMGIDVEVSGTGFSNIGLVVGASGATFNKAAVFGASATPGSGNVDIYGQLDLVGTMQFEDGNEAVGYVLASDATGNASWTDPATLISTSQNTLDQAYDEGGAGAGATITATDGVVTIAGEDGLLVTGTFGSGDVISTAGAGTRMFFNPRKSAFRAGSVSGGQWNDGSVGNYSSAFGDSNTASGINSFAIGNTNLASGNNSFASGFISTASGNASSVFGLENTAPSWGELVVGTYANTYTANSSSAFNANDQVFAVGNGTGTGARSNALTVYKSGEININDAFSLPTTDGTANQVLETDGAGQLSWVTPSTTPTASNGLSIGGGDVQLGGALTQDTNINPGVYDINFNLTNANGLFTVSTDGLVVENTGQVGMGNTSPTYQLDVVDNPNSFVASFTNENTAIQADGIRIQLESANPNASAYYAGFYRSTGTGTLTGRISGTVAGTGVQYLTTSDARLKTRFQPVSNALTTINKMEPTWYEYKENLGTKELGFIAQDLQKAYPQAVAGSPSDDPVSAPMMIDYGRLTPILTAGIKELHKKVTQLENENNALKKKLSKLERLEARIDALENKK